MTAAAHRKKGKELYLRAEYKAAYDEYRKALELEKTAATMANVAACLSALERYDEALDLYEEVLRMTPKPSPAVKAEVESQIMTLAGKVGTLELEGDVPAGAFLTMDGGKRTQLPLPAPLRVSAGTRLLRVEKDGFDPITAKLEIVAGKQNKHQLVAPSKKGRLKITEKHNWHLKIEIDGKYVDVTPWEGLVDIGDHEVRLYGFLGLDALAECTAPDAGSGGKPEAAQAGARMGSRTERATVALYQETPVALSAEELDASLRIESTPSGASLKIDSRSVGFTPWEGRLALGEHTVELSAGGFLTAKQAVRLGQRKQRELQIALEREPAPPGSDTARTVGAGVAYGVGALGLGIFAVTGAMALAQSEDIKSRCTEGLCPPSEQGNLDSVHTLGKVATVGLVVGGVGAVAGTVILLAVPSSTDLKAGLGPGRFAIAGRF